MLTIANPSVRVLPQRRRRLRSRLRPLRCSKEEGSSEDDVGEETKGVERQDTSKDLFFGGLFEVGQDPRLFGEDVDPDLTLPPEYEKDFWDDPKFEVTHKKEVGSVV